MGRHYQEMDRPGVRQVPEGSGEQGKMEKTGCKVICGAPTTLTVKGLTTMMMMINHKGRHKVCSAVYISFSVLSEPRRCSTEITDVIKWNFRGDTEENMKKKDDLR